MLTIPETTIPANETDFDTPLDPPKSYRKIQVLQINLFEISLRDTILGPPQRSNRIFIVRK